MKKRLFGSSQPWQKRITQVMTNASLMVCEDSTKVIFHYFCSTSICSTTSLKKNCQSSTTTLKSKASQSSCGCQSGFNHFSFTVSPMVLLSAFGITFSFMDLATSFKSLLQSCVWSRAIFFNSTCLASMTIWSPSKTTRNKRLVVSLRITFHQQSR